MVQQPLHPPQPRAGGAQFFAGTDLVKPGLVRVEEWRQDPGSVSDYKSTAWAAVGRKS